MNKDIFISYSSKDTTQVDNIVEMCKTNNLSYWFAPEQLVGKKHDEEIVPAIKNCKIFLIVLSENSRPRDGFLTSEWVRDELLTAREYGCCIQPVKLDTTVDLETNNLMFKGLPNYLDMSDGDVGNTTNTLYSLLSELLKDDNYKKKQIDVAKIVQDQQKIIIKDIETNLKNGFFDISENIINNNKTLEVGNESYILLLKTIIKMSKDPIKDMHNKDIELIVRNLHKLRESEFKNISYYLESMITKSYFKFNAIRNDISDEYDTLKILSKNEPRIKAKYYFMTRYIKNILNPEEYELQWI